MVLDALEQAVSPLGMEPQAAIPGIIGFIIVLYAGDAN